MPRLLPLLLAALAAPPAAGWGPGWTAPAPRPLAARAPSRRDVLGAAVASAAAAALAPASASAVNMGAMAEQLGYLPVPDANAEDGYAYAPLPSPTRSTPQAIKLAEHLARRGDTFYGAFWCPHCRHQRDVFGDAAVAKLRYVECARGGYKADDKLCAKKGIEGYPSWVIGGKVVSGEMPLDRIASLSGFKGFDASLEAQDWAQVNCKLSDGAAR